MLRQINTILSMPSAPFNLTYYKSVHTLRSSLLIPAYSKNSHQENITEHKKSESRSVSHAIMENNGFISNSSAAGFLTTLPLGKRVLNKLTNLIQHEMNLIDGQEIEMPTLCDLGLWIKTGRVELMGHELFTLKDRKEKQLCLCPTHEELVTSLVASFGKSLPMNCLGDNKSLRLYQITKKYRDESRPKHGLLRTREFLMKDMYTFHTNLECADKTYSGI